MARDDLAGHLLNDWLQLTGDFGALPAMRFYMVYRALGACAGRRAESRRYANGEPHRVGASLAGVSCCAQCVPGHPACCSVTGIRDRANPPPARRSPR